MRIASLAAAIILLLSVSAQADQPPDLETKPTLLYGQGNNCAQLYYPASAIRTGEQGAVLLKVFIDETGKITKADVTQSSGFGDLDKAATDCVLNGWHFRPATLSGHPIASTKPYRIVWKLAGGRELLSKSMPCQERFSQIQFSDYIDNDTVLEYRINPDGGVDGAFVAMSSGDQNFDAFAVQCVSELKYAPAGTAAIWGAEIVGTKNGIWLRDGHGVWNTCDDYMYPSALLGEKTEYVVILGFRIVGGGNLSDVSVEKSSGNMDLDSATLNCARTWQHTDRLFFGPNLNVKMRAKVTWRNGHAFVLETLAE